MTLREMTPQAAALYEMFSADEIDAQTLDDTLEAMKVQNAIECVENCVEVILQKKSDIAAIDAELRRLTDRKKSFEKDIDDLLWQIGMVLDSIGKKRVVTPLATASVNHSQAVDISDKELLPDEYWREKVTTTKEPDKVAIAKSIKAGMPVSGAVLVDRVKGYVK